MEQWIIEIITAFGYVGVFFLMLAENLFPPIPSEVIVPVAGLAVGAGTLNLWLVTYAALAGTLIGNLPWFVIRGCSAGSASWRWSPASGSGRRSSPRTSRRRSTGSTATAARRC